ncbi:hypothetical protein AB8E56_11550 [Francisella sp. 19X1-34]|nr:hypothetical protein [Francisella sp. 19X1-34]
MNIRLVQLSLFKFMLGLSVSQLFYGPTSNAIERENSILLFMIHINKSPNN